MYLVWFSSLNYELVVFILSMEYINVCNTFVCCDFIVVTFRIVDILSLIPVPPSLLYNFVLTLYHILVCVQHSLLMVFQWFCVYFVRHHCRRSLVRCLLFYLFISYASASAYVFSFSFSYFHHFTISVFIFFCLLFIICCLRYDAVCFVKVIADFIARIL